MTGSTRATGSILRLAVMGDNRISMDLGIGNCPLCTQFYLAECCGCPVYEATKQSGGHGTPYMAYSQKERDAGDVTQAQKELNFLKSLLPPTVESNDAKT